jgi:hypothetical protein
MKRGRQKVPDESLPKISAIFEEAFSFLKHPFFLRSGKASPFERNLTKFLLISF